MRRIGDVERGILDGKGYVVKLRVIERFHQSSEHH